MTTPRWQDSVEWKAAETATRDWIEAQSAEPSVAVYYAAKTAVAADRRILREQVEALTAETVDGHAIGAPHWLPRDAVLALIGDS